MSGPGAVRPSARRSAGAATSRFAAGILAADILAGLWRRKWLIVLTALVAAAAALAAREAMPRRYTASMQLAVATDATAAADLPAAIDARALVSDAALAAVAAREGLNQDPEFADPDETPRLDRAASGQTGGGERANLAALASLKRAVHVGAPSRGGVFVLSVTTAQPEKSKRLAEAMAREVVGRRGERDQSAAGAALAGIEQRLQEQNAETARAEEAVASFRARNTFDSAGQRLDHEQRLAEMVQRLGLARLRADETLTRHEKLLAAAKSGVASDDLPQSMTSPSLARLRARHAEVKRQADAMAATHGPRHPTLLEVRAQLDELGGQIADELKRAAEAARQEHEQAKAAELDLTRKLAALKAQAAEDEKLLAQLRQLERQAAASRALHDGLLARARELRERQDGDASGAIRIMSPSPHVAADGPALPALVLAAGIFGMLLAAALVAARDAVTGIVHSPRALTARSGLPVIASLPLSFPARPSWRRAGASRLPIVVAAGMADDPAAAALRALHGMVCARAPRGRARAVLVVGASDRIDGAGLALNLALAADLAGERALLIDFDRQHATLSRAIGGPAGTGLESVLSGHRPLFASLHGLAGCGVTVLPNFLLAPAAFARGDILARRLFAPAAGFDLIVADAGRPAGDAALAALADACDDIIVVTRAGRTKRASLKAARQALGANTAKVIGAAFLTRGGARRPRPLAAWSPARGGAARLRRRMSA